MKNWIFALLLVGTMFAVGAGEAADVRESGMEKKDSMAQGQASEAAGQAGEAANVRKSIMEKRYSMVQCRAEFIYAMAGHAEEYDESTDLSAETGAVEEEMETLGKYVEDGDTAGFNRYLTGMKSAFADAVAGIRTALHNALESHGEAGAQNQERNRVRTQMDEDYSEEHAKFSECMGNAARERVRAELALDSEWMGKGKETSGRLSERGYDASGLEAILAEAEVNAGQLEDAVDGDMDTLELEELRKEVWGHQFYLWAEFQQEKFGLFVDRISEATDEYDAELAEVTALLDEAASLGDDEIYGLEEARESKAFVNEAAGKLREIVNEIQGGNA